MRVLLVRGLFLAAVLLSGLLGGEVQVLDADRGRTAPLGPVQEPADGVPDLRVAVVGGAGQVDSGGLTGNRGNTGVETTVQSDYEPVTATVRGRVGDTVKVRLGLRDHGPGRIHDDEARGGFQVIPPEGTTITSVPYAFEDSRSQWACDRPKRPGGPYVCDIGDDDFYL